MLNEKRGLLGSVAGLSVAGFLVCALIIRSSNVRTALDEEDAEPTQYYTTAFPPGHRKGVGPGLSFGDPVLNKYNKYRFVLPCVKKGNCPKPEDTAYLNWKSLKQRSESSDEQLGHEFDFMASELESHAKICEDGYAGFDDDIKLCQDKAQRELCYKYEALSQICDESAKQQHNTFEGTKYFGSQYLLKSCASDSKKTLSDSCKESEKLPGVNVMHWPWMGHTTSTDIF